MSFQRRVFPSISMLLAFDAAARSGSFTAAAKELSMTQGGVSRQISALEDQLDTVLFNRARKSIDLTEVGRAYAEEIRPALQMIRDASLNAMTNPLNGTLNLAILPTFGTRWLMPRFPLFLKENPDITVHFVSKLSPFDFQTEDLHSAIHYGSPDWPDTVSTFLMGEEAVPVCSPKLARQYSPDNPQSIATLPLLHLETRANAWLDWFRLNELTPPEEGGMHFEQFSIIAQAAIAGLGVALLPKFMIQSELNRKELVAISNTSLTSEYGYYLVTPTNKVNYPPVSVFRAWLLKMIGGSND